MGVSEFSQDLSFKQEDAALLAGLGRTLVVRHVQALDGHFLRFTLLVNIPAIEHSPEETVTKLVADAQVGAVQLPVLEVRVYLSCGL